ncbi:MAG: hypothetical protein QM783_17895 [Phycisphaerales bacterium]
MPGSPPPSIPLPPGRTQAAARSAPNDLGLLARRRAELLATIVTTLNGIDKPPLWIAQHAGAFGYLTRPIAEFLAGAIDAGGADGAAVRQQLVDAAWSRDTHCGPTSAGLYALMLSSDHQAWEDVLKLVESAKREEGLRQRIAEFGDEAHPELFRKLLALILDQDLLRFSAIARAANVWFGINWDSSAERALTESVQTVAAMLDDSAKRSAAIASGTPHETYFALWTAAYEDLAVAVPAIQRIVTGTAGDPRRRCVALDILIQAHMNIGQPAALAALADPDLRVCAAPSSTSLRW